MREPNTLLEAVRFYADPEVAFAAAVEFRFPKGVHCPKCGRTDVKFIKTRKMWECREDHPRKQFSVKIGTLMEDSPLSLDKWFVAMWAIANCKNGVSSYELAASLGIAQRSAWHLLHRIRLAMRVTGSTDLMAGEIEVDETRVGGRVANMHASKKARNLKRSGSHAGEKTLVMGMLQRSSEKALSHVRVRIVSTTSVAALIPAIRETVKPGATVMTDELPAYRRLRKDYTHEFVTHSAEQYVNGRVHVNGIENFWSLLKRTLGGTYVSVEPFHLSRYLDEQAFRFNERKATPAERFRKVASSIVGLRLTWKELTSGSAEATA